MLQRSPTYIGALPDIDPFTVQDEQVAAREAGLRAEPVEEHPVPVGAVPDRRRFPNVHAQDADDHGEAAPARGLRRREAFRPAATTRGISDCAWRPTAICSRRSAQGKADVVTDTIERFTKTGIKLASGEELEADIIVTATGLNLQLFGGAEVIAQRRADRAQRHHGLQGHDADRTCRTWRSRSATPTRRGR